ncbi:MAG: rRNA pseudouridine synthase [Synergistales bacterium]|nr:rRNA pseudouridine synthase [Synergistales bacterium]
MERRKDKEDTYVRLNRFLAMCGFGSRRKVEEIIRDGRVSVDGSQVDVPSLMVSKKNLVCVDGERALPLKKVYLVMNKPEGVVCAVSDKYYRTVLDLLPVSMKDMGIFPVGRLDRMSSGLLIMTNDGELAQQVSHPSNNVSKSYEVLLNRAITGRDISKWKTGLSIEGKKLVPLSVEIIPREPSGRWIHITLREGIKREIRIMAQDLGYAVKMLTRKRIGKMELIFIPPGKYLSLGREELMDMIRNGGSL